MAIAGVNASLVSGTVGMYWSETIGTWLPSILPGMVADTTEWREWVEVSIATWRSPIQRPRGRHRLRVQLTGRVFVRRTSNLGRGTEIAEGLRSALAGICLAVRDPDDEGEEILGYVRFFEAEVRRSSGDERDASGSGIEMWSVEWRGMAESV